MPSKQASTRRQAPRGVPDQQASKSPRKTRKDQDQDQALADGRRQWVELDFAKFFFCNVCCLFVCLVSSHEPQLTQIRLKSTKSTKLGKSHKVRFQHFHTFPGSCLLLLVSRDLESKNSRKVRQKLGNAVKDRLTFCWCRRVYVYSSRSRLVSDVIIAVRRRTPRQCRNNRRQLMEVAIHPHDFNIVFLKSNCLVFG